MIQNEKHPVSRDTAWQEALEKCLGEDAIDLEQLAQRRRRTLGGDAVPLGLADLFFDPDDPLHPDRDDEEDDPFE
jgi:MoxR-like ATPase